MSFLVPAIFMRETMPLLGQAVNTIIPAILPWAAWPIRGQVVPHEKLAGNALASLFYVLARWLVGWLDQDGNKVI